MNRQTALRVFVFISLCCLGIALWFAAQGLWMPLPFAGLEVSALGACWWLTMRHAEQRQVIDLDAARVQVRDANRAERFDPYWVRLELAQAAARNHPDRLSLASHGRRVEVGPFLTNAERHQLKDTLEQTLRAVRTPPANADADRAPDC